MIKNVYDLSAKAIMDTSCGCCFPSANVFINLEILAPKWEIAPTMQHALVAEPTKPTINQPYMKADVSTANLNHNHEDAGV